MRYTVNTADLSSLRLGEPDSVRAVLQNISIILQTGQQTAILYRNFGIPWSMVDRPTPVVRPLLIAAIKEAIETYEPRATVETVTFSEDVTAPGRLVPTVEVTISDEP